MEPFLQALLKTIDPWIAPAATRLAWHFGRSGKGSGGEDAPPLIIRPGGMGDFICCHIALEEIGVDFRAMEWLVEKRSKPWAELHGFRCHYYNDDIPGLLGRLHGRHAPVINTEQLYGLSQAVALWCARSRDCVHAWETNRGLFPPMHAVPYDWRNEHEAEAMMRLLGSVLRPGTMPAPKPLKRSRRVPSTGTAVIWMAGRDAASRRFDREEWIRLGRWWRGGRETVIVASPSDEEFASGVASALNIELRQGSFADKCRMLSEAEEVLTVDGGAVHMASYYGVPTTAVFTSGRESKWLPLAEGSRILRRKDLACQPCARFGQVPPCPWNYECKRLDPERDTNPADFFRRPALWNEKGGSAS